ncbi:uncharacterized protein LOC104887273 isoform X4 [Beta vulgaris subsp. vulgaris]|uniref:uncharacterized protein LOC104887273 isoform X4 n=1 Tax=Beta vulgaris subsp. vulgaris TaxID=3555 RepID=UPI00254930B0|nr:uncharacterized protein LOC104887273 isoform X4 [Beta vulgaris subsp. vulgaris]
MNYEVLYSSITFWVTEFICFFPFIIEEGDSKKSIKMKEMEGIASIALLPCGSISGHFIRLSHSTCYGLHGTDSWGNDVTNEVEQKQKKSKIIISFECETLKAGAAAEEHIRQFMPKLAGMDAVVNTGKMTIKGLNFHEHDDETDDEQDT